METHDWKGWLLLCLSFYVSDRRTTSSLPYPPPPLARHSQISPSPSLLPFLSLNPAHLAVLAFRRSPSRIRQLLRRRRSCLTSSAVLEAAAGWVTRGWTRPRRLRGVGSPDGYRLLIHPDPRIRGKGTAFVGSPRPCRRVWRVGGEAGLWFSSCVGLVRGCFVGRGTGAAMRGGGHCARRGGGCRGGSGGFSGSSSSLGSCSSSCTTTRRSSSGRPSW